VRLEGEKERIEEFYDLEFNADLMVPDSMRSSQVIVDT